MSSERNVANVSLTARNLLRSVACFSVLLAVATMCVARSGPAHAGTTTYVSLTFDDGRASQRNAGALLADNGVRGTFYIVSGGVGSSPWYLDLSDVQGLAAAGNEIGGHTL